MVKLDGYELIIGSSLDPQLGPVLLFGTGGQLVEIFKDRALGLPPLNTTLARRMMEQTKILTALRGVRGRPPVNLAALEQLLVRFSVLVVEQRWIKEIDINPLLASPDRLLALDARVIIHESNVSDTEIPRPAIRPYPSQYITAWTAKNGSKLLLRPIRPEDEPLLVKFHGTLSERSVSRRYFHAIALERAGRSRASDPDLLHRLRSRNGPGSQPSRSHDRRTGNPRRRPVEQDPRNQRGRVRTLDRR